MVVRYIMTLEDSIYNAFSIIGGAWLGFPPKSTPLVSSDCLLELQVNEEEEKPVEEEEDVEMTEEQKAAEKAKPVSSTPVPGTPWSVN